MQILHKKLLCKLQKHALLLLSLYPSLECPYSECKDLNCIVLLTFRRIVFLEEFLVITHAMKCKTTHVLVSTTELKYFPNQFDKSRIWFSSSQPFDFELQRWLLQFWNPQNYFYFTFTFLVKGSMAHDCLMMLSILFIFVRTGFCALYICIQSIFPFQNPN